MTDQADTGSTAAETAARPTTYLEASASGRTWLDARDRWDELTRRDLSARARATLVARGQYDPARHGTSDPEPLTLAEHLEVLANGEVVARVYRHPAQVDQAVKAGATWEQIAEATGSTEAKVRQEYREFAQGQHDMWASTGAWEGEQPHRFGMTDADYAAAMVRLGDPETYPGGVGDPANVGIRTAVQGRVEADQDRAPGDLPDAALPTAADYIRDAAADLEAGR